MTEYIAERKLLYSNKNDDMRKEFLIRLSAPSVVQEGTVNFDLGKEIFFVCRIEIVGLTDPHQEVYGADSLQAVSLASNGVDALLKRLQKKYDIFFPSGESYF